jgi:hypothetical protein
MQICSAARKRKMSGFGGSLGGLEAAKGLKITEMTVSKGLFSGGCSRASNGLPHLFPPLTFLLHTLTGPAANHFLRLANPPLF